MFLLELWHSKSPLLYETSTIAPTISPYQHQIMNTLSTTVYKKQTIASWNWKPDYPPEKILIITHKNCDKQMI